MLMHLYWDRDGVPMDRDDWAAKMLDVEYKRVARTRLMDGADPRKVWDISTVWLGLDHSHGGDLPVIFETMVFAEGSRHDEACERYATLAAAREGHTAVAVTVAAEMTDPITMEEDGA